MLLKLPRADKMEHILSSERFPKKIWFLWLQGMAAAPVVVKKCYESWVVQNNGWEIIFLDRGNLHIYFDLPAITLTDQALSDIIRINLLGQYGGVWVDATCFCNKPLDTWIYNYIGQGFFAFERPGPDRMISSWFIASCKNSYITSALQSAVNGYWKANPKLIFYERSRWPFLAKYLPKHPQQWFEFFYTKILKIHPYFWFHFLFERIYIQDEKMKKCWDATPKISADIPHRLQNIGLFGPLSVEVKDEIDGGISPLYKLVWKYKPSDIQPDSILDYLLEKKF